MIENGANDIVVNEEKENDANKEDIGKKELINNESTVNKFDKSRLSQSTEIKLDLTNASNTPKSQQPIFLTNNNNNNNITLHPLTILEEINSEMDSLNKLFNRHLHLVTDGINEHSLINKSVQVQDDIIPVNKINKSVQISDKDEFFSFINSSNTKNKFKEDEL